MQAQAKKEDNVLKIGGLTILGLMVIYIVRLIIASSKFEPSNNQSFIDLWTEFQFYDIFITGVILVVLITICVLALRLIKKMTGQFRSSGASTYILMFVGLITFKFTIETVLLFYEAGRLNSYFEHRLIPQILMGSFWLIFDIFPVIVVIMLHRKNHSSYAYEEHVMICEMSEAYGSILSQNMNSADFDRLMKGSILSSLLSTNRHSDTHPEKDDGDFDLYDADNPPSKQLLLDI